MVNLTKYLDSHSFKIQYKFLIACSLVLVNVVLHISRNMLVAQFFSNQNQKINVIGLQSIVTFIIAIPINIMFFISWLNGFEFELIELFYGIIVGFLSAFLLYLSVFVVVKGKAGAADALIETNTFILALLDWLLFSRQPTMIQLLCIGLAFCSTLVIIIGNQGKRKVRVSYSC